MSTLIELLAKLVGLIDWILRRRADKADDPDAKRKKERTENEKAIADGTAGRRAESLLDRLPKSKGH